MLFADSGVKDMLVAEAVAEPNDVVIRPCLDLWFCVDVQQHIQQISPDLQSLWGETLAVGQTLAALVPKPPIQVDIASWLAASQNVLQEQPVVMLPAQAYQVGANTYYWAIQVKPLRIDDQTQFRCCLMDAQDWWQCQQQLTQTTAELQRIHQAFDKFMYAVSHDLRAPLRAIDGFTRLLAEQAADNQDREQARMLHIITNSSAQMTALLEDLLLLARLQGMTAHPKPTAMKPLIHEVWQALTPASTVLLVMDELPTALVDGELWRLVWRELLANAVKYSSKQAQPHLELSAEVTDTEIIYHLRDNGVGFDMRYVGKLFQMSQRLHSASQFAGTGMGLAIVARIVVDMHGGRVWVDSAVGSGSCFHLAIPK